MTLQKNIIFFLLLVFVAGAGFFIFNKAQTLFDQIEERKRIRTIHKMESIRRCLEESKTLTGKYPESLSSIAPCLPSSPNPFSDGWQRPIQIDYLEGAEPQIVSCGADGICSSLETKQDQHSPSRFGDDYVVLHGHWLAFGRGKCCGLESGSQTPISHSIRISGPLPTPDETGNFKLELTVETKGIDRDMDSFGFGVTAQALTGSWMLGKDALSKGRETLLWEENLNNGWDGAIAQRSLIVSCHPASKLLFKVRHHGGFEQATLSDNFAVLQCPQPSTL